MFSAFVFLAFLPEAVLPGELSKSPPSKDFKSTISLSSAGRFLPTYHWVGIQLDIIRCN
jgi:hypothetical protein